MIALVLERIAAYPDPAVWILSPSADAVLAQARAVEKRRDAGEKLPLFGVPFAIKDSIDLAGYPTTAACPAYSYVPERSATVVERLLDAGAIAVGKTNLDQFGTGLAGDRSPYGACRNVFNPEYISGGSSSGRAVAVAAGLVSFALGTDTAGSGRVPAAANNVVGLKPAPGLLEHGGHGPVLRVAGLHFVRDSDGRRCGLPVCRGTGPRRLRRSATIGLGTFAAPSESDLDFCGDHERAEHLPAIARRSSSKTAPGGSRSTMRRFAKPACCFTAVRGSRSVWRRSKHSSVRTATRCTPSRGSIIAGGSQYRAVDVFRAQQRLKTLREVCLRVFDQAEVLVVPTIPTLPKLSEVESDSVLWSRRLGTYTNFANLVGLSALAVPAAFTQSGLAGGITLLGPAGSERRLCEIGMAWQRQIDLPLGATGSRLPAASARVARKTSAPPEGLCARLGRRRPFAGRAVSSRRCAGWGRGSCGPAARLRNIAFTRFSISTRRDPGLLRADERGGRGRRRDLRLADGGLRPARRFGRAAAGDRHRRTGGRRSGQGISCVNRAPPAGRGTSRNSADGSPSAANRRGAPRRKRPPRA